MVGAWIVIAIVAVVLGGLGLPLRQGARERRKTRQELERIEALSPSETRSMALRLLEDRELFQCRAAVATDPLRPLPRGIAELLRRYDEVRRHEFQIGRFALSRRPRSTPTRRLMVPVLTACAPSPAVQAPPPHAGFPLEPPAQASFASV